MLDTVKKFLKISIQTIMDSQQARAELYLRQRGYTWDKDNRMYWNGIPFIF
jgi:hypothetical protein